MNTPALSLPSRRRAYRLLVLTELRLAWRYPIYLVPAVGIPVLLLVIFGSIPSLTRPNKEFGGVSFFTIYTPTLLVFVLYWMILRDSVAVARADESLTGLLAIAWTGIVVLAIVATPYKNIHNYVSLSYLFWYFSGLIAARRMRIAFAAKSAQSVVAVGAAAKAT